MNGNGSASSNAHPLGVATKDDIVILGINAFRVVAGEVSLLPDGTLIGEYETRSVPLDAVDDLYDDGARVLEVSSCYVGRWR
jgi:hypothetical protein